MQKAIFPLRHTWVSQEMGGKTSHLDTLAIDFGSLTQYLDYNLYAPFDGTVVWADSISMGGTIAFQSNEKVQYADGTIDYMTVITEHDNYRPAKGKVFKQGQLYSHMGTAGNVGKHCHLEVQKGQFKKYTGLTRQGYYKFPNTIEPYKALFLTKDTLIKYDPYEKLWKVLTEVTPAVNRDENKNQIKVLAEALRVRTQPSTSSDFIGFAKQNGIYDNLGVQKDNSYTWYKIAENQWVADNGQWLEVLNKIDLNAELKTVKAENEKLKKDIASLNTNIDNLKKDNAKLNTVISNVKKAIS